MTLKQVLFDEELQYRKEEGLVVAVAVVVVVEALPQQSRVSYHDDYDWYGVCGDYYARSS